MLWYYIMKITIEVSKEAEEILSTNELRERLARVINACVGQFVSSIKARGVQLSTTSMPKVPSLPDPDPKS